MSDAPILLVGPGRSGTNFVSMALDQCAGLRNVYEQRYVWTAGMRDMSTDVRPADSATPATSSFIRTHFLRLADGSESIRLVDKTPGNALRLEFCLRVFPNAQIINVIRDPLDNIASRVAELQNAGHKLGVHTPTEAGRTRILRHRLEHAGRLVRRGNIPMSRLPAAVADQLGEKLSIGLLGRTSRYGERVPGLAQILRHEGAIAALCHQWRALTVSAVQFGRKLSASQYIELRYEEVMRDPRAVGLSLARFLDIGDPSPLVSYLSENARPNTVSQWSRRIPRADATEIRDRLAPEIQFLGYGDELEPDEDAAARCVQS